ncbi:hypothetical protein [Roseivivax sediminis]|uniref:Uncharacterized protein n=1 Tax=Roseivivax sediminis TaxID=936889 RepID=A0A1I1SWV5_9RHOB|nr:hypothetical protein [Roseivivax sediminis]SFD48393.1 hypothetical protein SAMN04515678_101272 [Roseivivax sediminis]
MILASRQGRALVVFLLVATLSAAIPGYGIAFAAMVFGAPFIGLPALAVLYALAWWLDRRRGTLDLRAAILGLIAGGFIAFLFWAASFDPSGGPR